MAFLAKHPLLTYIDVWLKRFLPNISKNKARQTSALPILPTLPVSRIPIGTPPYTRKRQRGANIQVEQDDTQPGVITSITSVPTAPQQNIVAEEPTIPSPIVGTKGASPSNLPFLVYKHSITLVRGYFLPWSSLVLMYSLD